MSYGGYGGHNQKNSYQRRPNYGGGNRGYNRGGNNRGNNKRPRQRFTPIGDLPIDQIYDRTMFDDPWESMTINEKIEASYPAAGADQAAGPTPLVLGNAAVDQPFTIAGVDSTLNPAINEALAIQHRLELLVNRVCRTFSVSTQTPPNEDIFTALEQCIGAACSKYDAVKSLIN